MRTFARDFPGAGLTFPTRSELGPLQYSHFCGPRPLPSESGDILSLEAVAVFFGFGACFSRGAGCGGW